MTSTGSVIVDSEDQPEENPWQVEQEPRPGRSRKWLWWLLGAVLVAAAAFGVWWFEFRSEPETDEFTFETIQQVAEVSTGTFQTTVNVEGTVAAADTEDLNFTSAGTVTAVNVEVGDVVDAGDVVATIDSAELEAALAEAQAEYDDLEAQLADDIEDDASEEQISLDEARLAVAADNLENAEEALAGTELVAGIDGTITAVNLTVGEQLTTGGTGGVTTSGSDSGSGNSAASIGSGGNNPLAGAGTTDSSSSASSAHVAVVSVGTYMVELSIDTTDIDSIELGQEVTVTEATTSSSDFGGFPGGGGFPFGGGGGNPFGGGDNPFQGGNNPFGGGANPGEGGGAEAVTDAAVATGEVTEIGRIADASSGVASYTVTVEFVDENNLFYVGTTVIAEILTGERTDVVQVPSQAVTSDGDGSTVTVALDGTLEGTLESRPVITGETSGNMTEIRSGVEPGEVVVIEIDVPAGLLDGFSEDGFPGGGGFPGADQGQTPAQEDDQG
ncbi:MAG TPA: biotin/lipoyl-binding protein [Acidimicrobiia bacterium]|nr:biotin/lipoyl-binding protein [Acidimicrobiia bacterium]